MAEHGLRLAERRLIVRVADEADEHRAGYQHLCPDVALAILFVFPLPQRVSFHMRNVHRPLDIAFLGEGGRVLAVTRMVPGESGYVAPRAVRYALEAPAGMLAGWGIRVGGPPVEGLP